MKNTILAIAALCLSVSSATTYAQEKQLQPGDGLPRVSTELLSATDGTSMPYYKSADKNGLLVMFSCNTCPYVVKNEETTLKTIEYAKAHGVGVVIINSNEAKREGDDSFGAMKDYARKHGYTVPYLEDKQSMLADAFGANHTPEIFLFSNKNMLVYKGAMNDNPGNPASAQVVYINNAIDAMIAGKEVNPSTTKSIGCSIKRKS
jgi:thioredoxin-related protein